MKIIWRDDVRFERVVDIDGIRYAVPYTEDSPPPRAARRNPAGSTWVDGRLKGLAARNKARKLKRLLQRFDDAVKPPKGSLVGRQLVHQCD